jgi:UDP-N-acetyl-D-mannosaminuronic acid dehydrogenase
MANTLIGNQIHTPQEGIGGHCLKKDTKMYLDSCRSTGKMLTAAIEIDHDY